MPSRVKSEAAAGRPRPVQVAFRQWLETPARSSKPARGVGIAVVGHLVVLLAVLGFYWASVLAIDLRHTCLLDLEPAPDCKEYYAGAVAILEQGSYHIRIGDRLLPPRYPWLYSSLMVPVLLLTAPESHILCPFRVNQWAGLLALAGLYGFFLARRRPSAAVLSILVLSTLPAFVLFARSCTSDLPGSVWIMGCYGLIASAVSRRSRVRMYLAALLLGLSVCLRVQFVLFAPAVLLALHPCFGQAPTRRLRTLVTAAVVLGTGLCPVLMYNRATFGSCSSTGYHFWMSGYDEFSEVFNLRHAIRQFGGWGRELALTETGYRVANIFGAGMYYSPAFVVLAAWAIGDYLRSRTRIALALAALPFVLGSLLYFFVDLRLFLPVVLLSVPAIALLGERCLFRRDQRGALLRATAFALLLILSVVGYPSSAGFPPLTDRCQTWELLAHRSLDGVPCNWQAARALGRAAGEEGGLVFSPISPVYLNAVLGQSFAALPDSPQHDYNMSRHFHFGEAELQEALHEALARGRNVYHLAVGDRSVDAMNHTIPPPAGYHWQRILGTVVPIAIFQLTRSDYAAFRRWGRGNASVVATAVRADRAPSMTGKTTGPVRWATR